MLLSALRHYWGYPLALLLVFYINSLLLLHPVGIAEDITIHIRNALYYPWWQALLMPSVGYVSLYNNLAAITATHITSMPYWLHVTGLFAFSNIATCLAVPYLRHGAWWPSPLQRNIIPLIIALSGLHRGQEELWVSIIYGQFFFTIASALILFSDANGKISRRFCYGFLGLSMLTGVISCLLTPLFILKALKTQLASPHRRERVTLAVIATACSLIALGFALNERLSGINWLNRAYPIHPESLLLYLQQTLLLQPFFPKRILVALLQSQGQPALYGLSALMLLAGGILLNKRSHYVGLSLSALLAAFGFCNAIGNKDALTDLTSNDYRYAYSALALACIIWYSAAASWLRPAARHGRPRLYAARFLAVLAALAALWTAASNLQRTPYYLTTPAWYPQALKAQISPLYAFNILSRDGLYEYCNPSLCSAQREHAYNQLLQAKDPQTQLLMQQAPSRTYFTQGRRIQLSFPTGISPDKTALIMLKLGFFTGSGLIHVHCKNPDNGLQKNASFRMTHIARSMPLYVQNFNSPNAYCDITATRHSGIFYIELKGFHE